MADEQPIGKITHFFDKVGVAVIALNAKLKVGDKIKIGKKEEFIEQEVTSMQVNHKSIDVANKGDDVGLKVDAKVRAGDLVYKV